METDISSINSDFKYQLKEWPLKRFFWFLMGVFLFYGLLGGLGDNIGVLANKKVRVSGAIIEYENHLRIEKSFVTKVLLDDTVKNFTIGINQDYVDKVQVVQVIPEPVKVEIKSGKLFYHFATIGNGTIVFFNDPHKMGRQNLEIEVNNKTINLSQFVYF